MEERMDREQPLFEKEYFRDNYKGSYDARNPRYKHRSYLREVKCLAQGRRLLDVGCAYGAFLKEAIDQFEVHGCDISAHAVKIAAERVPAATVFQSDIFGVRPVATYDVITCFDILEHIDDVDRALAHLLTLLKPGGVMVVTVPVYDTVVGRLVETFDHDPTHVHKISRYEWLQRVTAAGFHQIYWKGILRFYLGGPFYLHYSGRFIRRFSPAILLSGIRQFILFLSTKDELANHMLSTAIF
jgi:SAM-dependent methyltransferase